MNKEKKLPIWLRKKLPCGFEIQETNSILQKNKLYTVCQEAKCPNKLECFSKKIATFLVLGKYCTRNCHFCNIDYSKNPPPVDEAEIYAISKSIDLLKLKHVVITMVTRDDLIDGGSIHLSKIIAHIQKNNPNVSIEALTSDFSGNFKALDRILDKKIEIYNHNLETVENLSAKIRDKANYLRSLSVLQYAKKRNKSLFIKSGLMVGLGETKKQVKQSILDLYNSGCDIITIGQYLQPNKKKYPVKEFVHPDIFQEYENYGKLLGIKKMCSSPFVRSSFNAQDTLLRLTKLSNKS
jgi:lipoyl synthase